MSLWGSGTAIARALIDATSAAGIAESSIARGARAPSRFVKAAAPAARDTRVAVHERVQISVPPRASAADTGPQEHRVERSGERVVGVVDHWDDMLRGRDELVLHVDHHRQR
jgi:hypothetical protein